MFTFEKLFLPKMCPILDSSDLSCLTRYQKILWEGLFRCQNLWISPNSLTMTFHNFSSFYPALLFRYGVQVNYYQKVEDWGKGREGQRGRRFIDFIKANSHDHDSPTWATRWLWACLGLFTKDKKVTFSSIF